ncbi:hypothetical protein PENSPDRAFT_153193 [Peniophora sp. CONT]|nr:hypothetical protein PENSPDRAFT_153193 [Peniophora sp. CONT]
MLPDDADGAVHANLPYGNMYVWHPDISARMQQSRDAMRSGRVGMDFRASLLDESRRLAHASRELRRLCNDSVPLLRMPPEIIDYIIDYLVVDWSPFGTTKIDQHGLPLDVCAVVSLGWITLGHVCHRFRGVLLGRRQLWASTVCSIPSSRAREQILSRCGDEPLDLRADYSSAGALIHPAAMAFGCGAYTIPRHSRICLVFSVRTPSSGNAGVGHNCHP